MQDLPPIIPAGTQVVSRLEVRGSQGACVHPRGAVGIVTEVANRLLIQARREAAQ